MFILLSLCLRLLAKTRYVMVSQNPLLLALLGFLQKSYVSLTLKQSALANNSGNKCKWINIVYGVKSQDNLFSLFYGTVQRYISFIQMITDVKCCLCTVYV